MKADQEGTQRETVVRKVRLLWLQDC